MRHPAPAGSAARDERGKLILPSCAVSCFAAAAFPTMARVRRAATLLAWALVAAGPARAGPAAARQSGTAGGRPVVVASKPFGESYLLAEIFAQILEARGYRVERRPGLGATEIAFRALRTGAIDVYPEYTGTGLVAILGEPPLSDPRAVFGRVAREFERRYAVHWLPPLGFQNTYAIAVRRETAARLGLRTLGDLARAAPRLTAGFTPDFIGREDGLPGLVRAYGLRPRQVRSLLQSVKYRALAAGEVDVIDGYSTDGFIARYDLVVLEDDRAFFPAYEAAPLVGQRLWREAPAAVAALTELSGRLDEARMRQLNRRVEVEGEEIARVAADVLAELGLAASRAGAAAATGAASAPGAASSSGDETGAQGSLVAYLWGRRALILSLTLRHLLLVAVSLAAGVLLAVPLGLGLERLPGGAEAAIRGVGLLQTIPGIALLAFMIPLLGIGVTPALVALFLYSLYPILRNTYTGVRDASPDAVGAATALGMTPLQVLRLVRLPLAAPVIMAGIRTAGVINVGTATLAAFIGAGGLGDPIVAGLALSDTRMILSGAIPAALLALLVDGILALSERWVQPGGLRP
ncbi:MAG: ABC transporter permease subunit [Gemmatimonadetes bacterium]|nr:ABC transporter permease subunit [Gemmatimonadota bacterium]